MRRRHPQRLQRLSGHEDAGAAYVFERQTDGSWLETAKLATSDGDVGDRLGSDASLVADRALLGAPLADISGVTSAGAAYVFERQSDGSWVETAKLTAASPTEHAGFASSVSLGNDRALVGASRADHSGLTDPGAAYVFERQTDSSWVEAAELTASDPSADDELGRAVSLSGARALLGAPAIATVYLFERQADGSWRQTFELFSAFAGAPFFGASVALSGDRALVGAEGGSAYIIEL